MFSPRKFDPELEKLRDEVSGPPNLDTVLLRIQKLSSQVHASYLFENEGKPILQKLCLLLSATSTGKMYADWKDFAAHLGLLGEQIRCIDHDFKGLEDPTYYVLLTYVQSPEATLDKILTTLTKIERMDIINRIKDSVTDFIGNLFSNKSTDHNMEILRPKITPKAPLVLSPMLQIIVAPNELINTSQGVSHITRNDNKRRNTCPIYGSVVILTFANDGVECANKITKIFRSTVPKIGVLMLNEQEKYVYSRGIEFVDDCFKQVDYIIPILTKDYIKQINSPVNLYSHGNGTLDTKYLKYMYSLLRYEYIRQDCCNSRVRCIVPDNEMKNIVNSDLHPTLQAWFRESDIEVFTERILLKKF
ncbi:uncharacterized protein LOC117167317 [Belonocnema kinseyi]|uniref:uncharacterized protein LOC117167317 n=1 Tax=Belonocnema kinseyi TaxID=2817044 RepID=UPI00143D2468|nr:uncharacterized protein LOC117167317 [Belonocnema kinseyi]